MVKVIYFHFVVETHLIVLMQRFTFFYWNLFAGKPSSSLAATSTLRRTSPRRCGTRGRSCGSSWSRPRRGSPWPRCRYATTSWSWGRTCTRTTRWRGRWSWWWADWVERTEDVTARPVSPPHLTTPGLRQGQSPPGEGRNWRRHSPLVGTLSQWH